MKISNLIADVVFTITHPSHWLRLRDTNKELDAFILEALKNPKFERVGGHTAVLNGVKLWICNYPYSFGYLYESSNVMGMPSRRTVVKLAEALNKHIMKDLNESN